MQRAANDLDGKVRPLMVMETARGCWWDAKHHCTFCGLNGEFMGFRSKSPLRALAENLRSTIDRPLRRARLNPVKAAVR